MGQVPQIHWVQRKQRELKHLFENRELMRELMNAGRNKQALLSVMAKYDVNPDLVVLVVSHIMNDGSDFDRFGTPINVISKLDETWNDSKLTYAILSNLDESLGRKPLYLEIDPNCTKQDMTDFIRDHWDFFVVPKQLLMGGQPKKRVVTRIKLDRDAKIAELYKNRKKLGIDVYEIADQMGMSDSVEQISVIANRFIKRNK